MKKAQYILIILVIILLLGANVSNAHPGRTDSSGCHTCRTNCSSWGLHPGEYHCHNAKGPDQPLDPITCSLGSGCVPAPDYRWPTNNATNCGWGYQLTNGRCIYVRVPRNAHLAAGHQKEGANKWDCNNGYEGMRTLTSTQEGYIDSCRLVVPRNASLSNTGNSWNCNSGYKEVGLACELIVPKNAHRSGDFWDCDDGYSVSEDGNSCQKIIPPMNAHVQWHSWVCDFGYKQIGNKCEKVIAPENATILGDYWKCNDGYRQNGQACDKVIAPSNAHVAGDKWICDHDYKLNEAKNGCKRMNWWERLWN